MSLADLVPVIKVTRIPRRSQSRTAIQRRYRIKHRAKLNAYRRKWRASRGLA